MRDEQQSHLFQNCTRISMTRMGGVMPLFLIACSCGTEAAFNPKSVKPEAQASLSAVASKHWGHDP